jgi:quercetin dioxygenase-like cupin family protein
MEDNALLKVFMHYLSLPEISTTSVSHNAAIQKKVMLAKGDLPCLTNFSQATFQPGQVASAHAHPDMYEVFFVASGQGTIAINQTPHILQPGICVAVEPGETHEVSNTGTEPLTLLYFGIQPDAAMI